MEQNMKKSAEPEVTGAPQAKCAQIRFSARDWLALSLALGCALLWFAAFGIDAMFGETLRLPALGAAAFTAALWASVLLYLGRDARWSVWNGVLTAGVGLLTVCCCIYGDTDVRMIDFLLIAAGSALGFFSLAGVSQRALGDVNVVWETFLLTFRALFSNWDKPFRGLAALRTGGSGTRRQVLWGALAALPLLALVLWLLASADAVFGSLFAGLADWLARMDVPRTLWKIVRTVLWTLLTFSALWFLRHPPERKAPGASRSPAPAAPFVPVLALLDAVYAVFVVIQFTYLFGGAQTAAMEGGWAEYARSGFFQLVKASALDLLVVLVCAARAERKPAVKLLSTLLLALTAVVLFSAYWRMRLYITAYGLSLLRAETLWAMLFIAACLVLAGVKVWRPGFRFWPFFAALGLFGWVIFNAVNVDARIAEHNVDAYLSGTLEEVDVEYLSGLSADALPALERLRDAVGGGYRGGEDPAGPDLDQAIADLEAGARASGWQNWCLTNARHR